MKVNINKNLVISYDEYRKLNLGSSWNDYWTKILQPLYMKEYLKIIKKYNLTDLLEDIFNKFDFAIVEEHMRNVNWCWCDTKTPPTIDDMKLAVMELLVNSMPIGGCSTGGFYVHVETPLKIKISFENEDYDFKIEAETKLSIIRKNKLLKLKKILNK